MSIIFINAVLSKKSGAQISSKFNQVPMEQMIIKKSKKK